MKRIVFLFFMLLGVAAVAAPVFNAPAVLTQPNGDTLRCLVSGDEYWHRLHDAKGYTIVQNPDNGWWVYADTIHSDRTHWDLVATTLLPGHDDPEAAGLAPNLGLDHDSWLQCQHRLDVPKEYIPRASKTSGRNHGTLNNIVIFVRFSDESEISTSLSTIDAMFNDSSASATSMYSYFKRVSYNKIFIPTSYYPAPNGNSVVSYQDIYPRSYYMPYNAATNTNGYQNSNESRQREFGLLERAVNYVNQNSPVPTSINLDMDNDGNVDNICFVLKGTYTGWNDLLWPHKWSLYDRQVSINGKRVYTFNLQLEGSGEHYFSSSTFCHEMFHSLGAPDLYRYNVGTDVSGVGSWDLMCSNTTPPQHMSAYMKWKYGNWLDSIPEITLPGSYTLHSLGDATYDNCVYKIAAQEPNQWYVLEYRDYNEQFETALPGKGLLIYRIDDRYEGNANYDGVNYFDEVYLFRPNAGDDMTNGNLSQAYFSGSTVRTTFTPATNPHPWLTGNIIDTTFSITNITVPDETISFTYSDLRGCVEPYSLVVRELTGVSALLAWSGNAPTYTVEYGMSGQNELLSATATGRSLIIEDLDLSTSYRWRVKAICGDGDESQFSPWNEFTTADCASPHDITVGTSDTAFYQLPVNTGTDYTYSQMIYSSEEVGDEMVISQIGFDYSSSYPLNYKNNCVIYLGNTTQSAFSGISMSNFVPFSQLRKVYEGPLNCQQGWNYFVLDSAFHYDGTSNLVVAIDDNSGHGDDTKPKFRCTRTGTTFSSLSIYGSSNPDPSASSNAGSKSRKNYRPDIRFNGCDMDEITTYCHLTVTVNNPLLGDAWCVVDASGEHQNDVTLPKGTHVLLVAKTLDDAAVFTSWNDGDTSSNRIIVLTSDSVMTAHFSASDEGIEDNVDGIKIMRSDNHVTVTGADGLVLSLHDLLGRQLSSVRASASQQIILPGHGVYLLNIEGRSTRKIVY